MTASIVAARRRKPVFVLMTLVLLAALLLPAASPAAASSPQSYGYGAPPYAQAITNVNIRSGPSTAYPVIGIVYAGQIVRVLGVGQGGWYQIACQSQGYVTCWITGSPQNVRPLYSLPSYPSQPGTCYPPSCTPPAPPPPPPKPCYGYPPSCTTATPSQIQALRVVNVRSGPGMGYYVVGQLAPWQVVQVTGVSADGYWYRIVCPFYCPTACWVSSQSWLVKPVRY